MFGCVVAVIPNRMCGHAIAQLEGLSSFFTTKDVTHIAQYYTIYTGAENQFALYMCGVAFIRLKVVMSTCRGYDSPLW